MSVSLVIQNTVQTRPEGPGILDTIKVKMSDVEYQYHTCDLFKKAVDTKFNMDKLINDGYSLNEILNIGAGILSDETERLVLKKLREYIKANPIENK